MKDDLQNRNFVPLASLANSSARPRYWRSLEEYAGAAGNAESECAAETEDFADAISRRQFLQLAGASLALAGLTGCTRPPTTTILPYVNQPENLIPGQPKYYATAVPVAGLLQGVIVESHMGRPTKIEGNPDHPASKGATSVHAQSSVLDLYDPDRAKEIRFESEGRSWNDFLLALDRLLSPLHAGKVAGLRILTETVYSPSLGDRIQAVLNLFPGARWHQYDPAGPHSARAGAQLAFGRPVNTNYKLLEADIVLALDSDFLACGEGSTRLAHDFAARRTRGDRTDMNRLYAVESTMTATGGKADHRLRLRYSQVESFARDLASAVGVSGVAGAAQPVAPQWVAAVSRDLMAHRGASAVIAGEHQSPAVHALAHAMNATLGNVGKTVIYTEPLEVQPVDQIASLRQLIADMNSGNVALLLILGGNPVYNAPADLGFLQALQKVPTAIHVGLHDDETSAHCAWHVPESHFLEEWSDGRSSDGTVSILQPLIAPLYDSYSQLTILDAIFNYPGRTSYEIVREYWTKNSGATDFEPWWRKSVHDGLVAGSALPAITPTSQANWAALPAAGENSSGLELVFRPDPYLYDGRFANNTWLQELPQPMTKLTWDNAVYVSPATARRLGLISQNRVALQYRGRTVEGDVWVLPGHPDESVTIHLGWGRWRAGHAGSGPGFNAYQLRTSDALWSGSGLNLQKLEVNFPLASTQTQQTMEGRDLILSHTADEYKRDPNFAKRKADEPASGLTLYPKWDYSGYAWGMSIDLTRCVNCNACVVACQAENNIPVVGKEQVLTRRAMHWLRIDTYYKGDPEDPEAYYQPVPCMQCENAPCELVCPVQATQHSSDGLNDMIYNRCVGTRYCSNNCPYKVRRFNFTLFQDWVTESIKLQRNPDVTVRSRGVMEKCTYCVQRIREADIRARIDNRYIRDGEVQTACQQACPTQAIIFGDINNKNNHVARLKALNLDYALLAELNTRPRTTYLAELRNPNPELHEESQS
jgi:MoCo/4Fe-4S cofactor protein with predicted Tat translocation signal